MEWGNNMAINLLALANKLASGLGSGSSGSRTRTSYQNQPGNLRRGTHIPGTNLQEDEGIRKTARKGRKGDTKLRKVGGRVAHVNTTEANAIDKLGPLGEAWVERIGSGTINPSTGLKEYHLWHRHGAHTSIGKKIQGFAENVSGTADDFYVNAEEEENRRLYGSRYAESGGNQYYTDQLNSLLNKNIAGIQSDALEEGGPLADSGLLPTDFEGPLPGPPYGNFEEMMDKQFKLTPSSSDYSTFGPTYKGKIEEDKLLDDYQRLDDEYDIEFGEGGVESDMSTQDIKSSGIAQTLKDSMSAVGTAIKTTASNLSSGLFGLLTQSSQKTGQAGFAGQGDFQTEFAQDQMLKDANTSFQDADAKRESAQTIADLDTKELANIKETADITLLDNKADIIGQIQGLQDEYNKAFHTSGNTWITKKYG